jgi:hypothetical protein
LTAEEEEVVVVVVDVVDVEKAPRLTTTYTFGTLPLGKIAVQSLTIGAPTFTTLRHAPVSTSHSRRVPSRELESELRIFNGW